MAADRSSTYQKIWEATLKDAAGVLAAYITPEGYGLSTTNVQSVAENSDDDFKQQISARLDLGRTSVFLGLLDDLDRAATSSFRHEISYSERLVRGKLHVPRWLREHARGLGRRIPVIRAERQLITPENLLISEASLVSAQVARAWKKEGGAEGLMAQDALKKLASFEAEEPWSELRSKPRQQLQTLVEFVRGRLRSGAAQRGGVIEKIVDLFSTRAGNAAAFEAAVGPLSLLVADDPAFEDRLFELVCLGWIVSGLKSHLEEVRVFPRALRGAQKGPLLEGSIRGVQLRLFYQKGADLLPPGRWLYKHSSKPLRAIPDVVIEAMNKATAAKRLLLIDAKNRSVSSESDVAYKLIGYQDNLGLTPYVAVGMYPRYYGSVRTRVLTRDATRTVALVHLPLASGARVVKRLCDRLLAGI